MNKLNNKMSFFNVNLHITIIVVVSFSMSLSGQSDYQIVLNCLQSDSITFEKEINEFHDNGKLKTKGKYVRKPFQKCGIPYVDHFIGTRTSYGNNGMILDSTIYNQYGIALEIYLFTSKDAKCYYKFVNTDPEDLQIKIAEFLRVKAKSYEIFWIYPENQITCSHRIFKKGKKHGFTRGYYLDGSIRVEKNFDYGKRISTKRFKQTDESKQKIKVLQESLKEVRKS